MWASRKKSSTPKRGTPQNRLIRINHSRRAFLMSTPVGNSSPTLCPPCPCALCVKFPFPASLFIAAFASEGRLVAQGAAPFAGPEAFSYRLFPHHLRKRHERLSLALSALMQNESATRAESALTFLKDLNMTGINTYKKNDDPTRGRSEKATYRMRFSRLTKLFLWVPHPLTLSCEGSILRVRFFFLSPTAVIPWPFVAQVAAVISSQRDLRLLSAKAHSSLHFATPAECALTQKHRGGGCASLALLMLSSRAPSRGPQRAPRLRVLGWEARGICFWVFTGVSAGRLHSRAEHRSLREIRITAR